jgi:plastocyanin
MPFKSHYLFGTILLLGICANQEGFAKTHIVNVISDYKNVRMYFEPKTLTIQKGDTVKWINESDEKHNMMSYPDGIPEGAKHFESPYLNKKGESWSYTFTHVGTFEYHCLPHTLMGMRGSIIVERHSKLEEMHKPTAEELQTYRAMMLKIFDPEEYEYMPNYVREKLDKLHK